MAILIPSKNIYEIQNVKVRNNLISSVNAELLEFDSVREIQTVSFDLNQELKQDSYPIIELKDFANLGYKNISFTNELRENEYYYFVNFEYDLSLPENFSFLEDLSVTTTNTLTLRVEGQDTITNEVFKIYNPDTSGDFEFSIIKTASEFDTLSSGNWGKLAILRQNNTQYRIFAKILYLVLNLSDFGQLENYTRSTQRSFELSVKPLKSKEYYYPEDLKDKTFDLPYNELFYKDNSINEEPLFEYVSQNIISQYEFGKETATILCDISDYYEYDENSHDKKGEKVISVLDKKMSFHLNDEVMPMIFGSDGKDRPMSYYKDGTPKCFKVVGSNIIYDGAVWQKISLQEITKSTLQS